MANKKVLIIDDSEIDRSILKNILDEDYDIIEAENGFKGIETLLSRRRVIDGVLLDLHMPILDGFHVLELMKENGLSDIPVIIITSESTEQNLMKTVSYNIRDFIRAESCKDQGTQSICRTLTGFHGYIPCSFL